MEFDEIIITEIPVEELGELVEQAALEDMIRYDVPGVEVAIVSGQPELMGSLMDSVQGDEIVGAQGTCGLTSISNICALNGMNVTEGIVVEHALENGLCAYDPWDPGITGGTTLEQQVQIFDDFGIKSHIEMAPQLDKEALAEAIDDGKGISLRLNAGELWDEPSAVTLFDGQPVANHVVTVTGYARDAATGEISGFYICDSGRGLESDACRYVDIEKFSKAYGEHVLNSGAVITDEPLMMRG